MSEKNVGVASGNGFSEESVMGTQSQRCSDISEVILHHQGEATDATFYSFLTSVVVDADLRTFLLVCMALSSHRLTVPSIGAGGGIWNVLKPYLSVV